MNPISVSTNFLLEDGVDKDTTYVVIDTYKFSTTVTVALEDDKIDKVYCEPDVEDLDKYKNRSDFLAGGEVANGIDEPIGNSPSLIRETDFPVSQIALTSDNGAKRVHQFLDGGATNVILGCLRNAGSVADYLENEENWVLLPADAGNTPRFEDYMGAILIKNLMHGMEANERVFSEYEKRTDDAVIGERFDKKTQVDWDICINAGSSDVVPEWNSDGYFE